MSRIAPNSLPAIVRRSKAELECPAPGATARARNTAILQVIVKCRAMRNAMLSGSESPNAWLKGCGPDGRIGSLTAVEVILLTLDSSWITRPNRGKCQPQTGCDAWP